MARHPVEVRVPDVIHEVVREDLARVVPFMARAMKKPPNKMAPGMPDDGMTLDGYGAVFGVEVVIDSWEGTFRETIAAGSFRKSLRERTPKMQFDHGRHPLIGSIPIGTFDEGYPQEDEQGLHVVGRLADNWLILPVREAVASGAIDGMSFRFSVVRETWTDASGRKLTDPRMIAEFLWRPPEDGLLLRTLQELKLSEVGPVVWPAYDQTSVGMRTGVIDLARLHEPATRRLLAQAVLIADVADGEQSTTSTTAGPRPSVVPPARHADQAPVGSGGAPGEHPMPTQDQAGLRSAMTRWRDSRRVVIEHTQRSTT
jgi:HK97 family phage prohead protease